MISLFKKGSASCLQVSKQCYNSNWSAAARFISIVEDESANVEDCRFQRRGPINKLAAFNSNKHKRCNRIENVFLQSIFRDVHSPFVCFAVQNDCRKISSLLCSKPFLNIALTSSKWSLLTITTNHFLREFIAWAFQAWTFYCADTRETIEKVCMIIWSETWKQRHTHEKKSRSQQRNSW